MFVVSGLPANLTATGLVIQMSRGPKLATTKETELTPEHKADCGNIRIDGRLSFVATLFSSKTGKATGYSDKRFRVSFARSADLDSFLDSVRVDPFTCTYSHPESGLDTTVTIGVETDRPQHIRCPWSEEPNDPKL